jgi:hypothetical protein
MAIPTEHVQAGELIRAELMNAIIESLGNLDTRLSVLEGSPPTGGPYPQVVITGISPATPREGDPLTVIGENFDVSVAAAVVKLGNITVPSFKAGSSDTKLVFTVPNLGITAPNGQVLTMTVSNFATMATRAVTVLPKQQTFQGNVDINYVSGSTLTPGTTAIIRFTATSDGSPAVGVALSAEASTGWSGLQILDNQAPAQPIPGGAITVPALGVVAFAVGVPIPSSVSSGTPFDLAVTGTYAGKTSARAKQLTVGSSAPVEDPTIPTLDVRGIDGGSQTGSTIEVAPGTSAELTVEVVFTQADDYDVTVKLEPASAQWTVATDVTTPTSSKPSYTIDASDLVAGQASRTFLVGLTPKSGATATPNLHIVAKHKGGPLTRDLLAQLNPAS